MYLNIDIKSIPLRFRNMYGFGHYMDMFIRHIKCDGCNIIHMINLEELDRKIVKKFIKEIIVQGDVDKIYLYLDEEGKYAKSHKSFLYGDIVVVKPKGAYYEKRKKNNSSN